VGGGCRRAGRMGVDRTAGRRGLACGGAAWGCAGEQGVAVGDRVGWVGGCR
jgi:hypothetical protein